MNVKLFMFGVVHIKSELNNKSDCENYVWGQKIQIIINYRDKINFYSHHRNMSK